MSQDTPSKRFPMLSIDSCLSQYPGQKFLSDVALVRIRQPHSNVILRSEIDVFHPNQDLESPVAPNTELNLDAGLGQGEALGNFFDR
jgi:hypothetical protein